MTKRFDVSAGRFLDWLQVSAIPLWRDKAKDPAGGYFESLSHSGEPLLGAAKRLRVQARQAFSFARAEHLGFMESGREASDHAWRLLLDRGRRDGPDGKPAFIHVFGAANEVLDDKIDLYDHAFVLLASTERELRYGCPEAADVSREIISLLTSLRNPSGGFSEGVPAELPRRTNPHMHLLEVCLVRRDLDCPFARETIEEILDLWDRVFWDDQAQVLREFFADDWTVDEATGDLIEPGHMAEWLYLLDSAGRLDLDDALGHLIFSRARELGIGGDRPLLCDTYDLATQRTSPGCRLWGQTEHIRAAVVMARKTGDPADLDLASELLDHFHELYLDPVTKGGWIDRLAPNGEVLSDKMPTSLLYHLITMAEEVAGFVKKKAG